MEIHTELAQQLLFGGTNIFLKLSLYTHDLDLIKKKKRHPRDFSGSQVVKTLCFSVGATDLIFVWGTKSHVLHGQKKVILNVRNRIKA